MKRLFLLVLFVFVSSAWAQEQERLEINTHGKVRKVENSEGWRQLTPAELEAYHNPDSQIVYGDSKKVIQTKDFFHYRILTILSKAVTYNTELGMHYENDVEFIKNDEENFSWHILLLLISAFCMIISNIVASVNIRYRISTTFAIFSTIFAFFAFVASTGQIFSAHFTIFALVAFAFASFSAVKINNKLIIIYYISVVIAFLI